MNTPKKDTNNIVSEDIRLVEAKEAAKETLEQYISYTQNNKVKERVRLLFDNIEGIKVDRGSGRIFWPGDEDKKNRSENLGAFELIEIYAHIQKNLNATMDTFANNRKIDKNFKPTITKLVMKEKMRDAVRAVVHFHISASQDVLDTLLRYKGSFEKGKKR